MADIVDLGPNVRSGELTRAADEAEAHGDLLAAIDLLTRSNRLQPRTAKERRLVTLRHRAFTTMTAPRREPPRDVPDDPFPGMTTLPEVDVEELTPDLVRGAVRNHGGILVRRLCPPEPIPHLVECIDRTLEVMPRHFAGAPVSETIPWYEPFGTVFPVFGEGVEWFRAMDSPRSLFATIEAITPVVDDIIVPLLGGARPALARNKVTLRRSTPDCEGGWHQDGYFLGGDTWVYSVWVALSRCGGDSTACGLEILPRAVDAVAPTGTDGVHAVLIDPADVTRIADGRPTQDPVFEAGDGIIFDQLTIHRTGHKPGLTDVRYGIECWLFEPSSYPQESDPPVRMVF